MHELLGVDDLAAEDEPHGLVAEADAEHRDLSGEGRMASHEMPASSGRPGPGEMTMAAGAQLFDFGDGDGVVAEHLHSAASCQILTRL